MRVPAFSLLLVAMVAAAAEPVTLTVNVTGAEPNRGQVILSLFDSQETYLRSAIHRATAAVDGGGGVTFTIPELPLGTYAVSVVHDENNNDAMDTGFMRIPKEKVGFSNNARSSFGPPAFSKARFELTESRTMDISLVKAVD